MIPRDVNAPTVAIPFHRLLKIVAIVDSDSPQTMKLIEHLGAEDSEIEIYPPGIGVVLPGERWDQKAQPMLDYFLAFQESFNRFPGFNYEVQGVFQERVNGRIKFHTYVVRQ
jgi:hypothetical protein